jgi:hypothetical protein
VCHLWNLIADETREGEVYRTLLDKMEEARKALGGQVFDILGKVVFEGRPLRELLVEAVRYGERPEVRARLSQIVANAFDRSKLNNSNLIRIVSLRKSSGGCARAFGHGATSIACMHSQRPPATSQTSMKRDWSF